ncbi:hypothetical protein EG68_07537 [Paragonimus skrjabini miyazakii]|uniref:Uncharacterized protein n=1 Tax=Paragonimus skrjabini miyazakii TaxID=59628 RepID=A0A8S9YJY5_9TREM|nr:hypothetical protein EG68_07537 [Paragonimus skrjabini miyazakii]
MRCYSHTQPLVRQQPHYSRRAPNANHRGPAAAQLEFEGYCGIQAAEVPPDLTTTLNAVLQAAIGAFAGEGSQMITETFQTIKLIFFGVVVRVPLGFQDGLVPDAAANVYWLQFHS